MYKTPRYGIKEGASREQKDAPCLPMAVEMGCLPAAVGVVTWRGGIWLTLTMLILLLLMIWVSVMRG